MISLLKTKKYKILFYCIISVLLLSCSEENVASSNTTETNSNSSSPLSSEDENTTSTNTIETNNTTSLPLSSSEDNATSTENNDTSTSDNTIIISNISLHATFHNVGIQVNYTGDDNKNAIATVEANINNAGFKPTHELTRVYLKTIPTGNYPQRFVGTVFSVEPESTVDIRVTISDEDGTSNAVQTASIVTRSKSIPTASLNSIHVATTGDDITGTGSNLAPYKTIQHAVNQLSVGATLLIHAGTYQEHVSITYNQNSLNQAYTTIKSAGDGEVILEGTDLTTLDDTAWQNEGEDIYSSSLDSPNNETYYVGFNGNRMWKYNSLSELKSTSFGVSLGGFYSDITTSKVYAKFPNAVTPTGHQISVSNLKHAFEIDHVNNIVFDGITFNNFNSAEHSAAIHVTDNSNNIWIVNSRFKHMETAIRLEAKVNDLVVMNNEFSDQGIGAFAWDAVKEHQHWLERGALYCSNDEYSGQGVIFDNNYVHEMFDGVKIVGTEILTIPSNADVEHNRFENLSDDGIETDGYSSNVRIQHNDFKAMLIGVSVAPALGGPTYINYNLMADLKNVAQTDYSVGAVKFSLGDEVYGDIFIYHNTGTTNETNREAFSVSNEADWTKLVMRNNIWSGQSYALYYYLDNASELNFSEDYDLLYASSNLAVQYQGEDYPDIIDYFNISQQCEHCIESNPLFVDSNKHDYNLTLGSPARNTGIVIEGINDNYNETAPDMGAFEFK